MGNAAHPAMRELYAGQRNRNTEYLRHGSGAACNKVIQIDSVSRSSCLADDYLNFCKCSLQTLSRCMELHIAVQNAYSMGVHHHGVGQFVDSVEINQNICPGRFFLTPSHANAPA